MSKNLKEISKQGWVTAGVNPTVEELKVSALIRIADTLESVAPNFLLMTKEYVQMKRDLEYYADGFRSRGEDIQTLERKNAALRGVITRMKNQQAADKDGE